MDNINILELSNEELLDFYKTVKQFVEFLENEKKKEDNQEDVL